MISADLKTALEGLGLSTEQIQERVADACSLPDGHEKRRRLLEAARWAMAAIAQSDSEAFVAASKEMGLEPSEAAAFGKLKASSDEIAHTTVGVIASARAREETILHAFVDWRSSPDCWRLIHGGSNIDIEGDPSVFARYIVSTLDPCVRAELIAKVEKYCEAGYADADLLSEPETEAAERLRRIADRMGTGEPTVSSVDVAEAVRARFQEIFVDLKTIALHADDSPNRIFLAEKMAPGDSAFDALTNKEGGSVVGCGSVEAALITHPSRGHPARLLVASVAIGNPFGTQIYLFLRHASALSALVASGGLAGARAVEFTRYAQPSFYLEDTHNEINREIAGHFDAQTKCAANLVGALADLSVRINNPLFDLDLLLRAPLALFGAPGPRHVAKESAMAPALSDPRSAALLLVKEAFSSIALVMEKLSPLGHLLVEGGDSDELGANCARAAVGLVKAFGDYPGLDAEVERLGKAIGALKSATQDYDSKTSHELTMLNLVLSSDAVGAAKRISQKSKPTKESVLQAHKAQANMARARADATAPELPRTPT